MTTPKSSASSFIEQIKAEYREVVGAETNALPHAIKCGEFLNLAKENLKVEKGGKWSEWLKANCPEIPQTTASLYMRLAENKKLAAKAKSIREANEAIRKANNRTRTPSQSADRADGDGQTNDSERSSRSFEDQVEAFEPDQLLNMLVEGWDDDDNKLAQLAKLIGDHLQKKKLTPPQISNGVANSPSDLGIPSSLRRPVETKQPR